MREQLLQLEMLRDWLKTPSFPKSGRIFDGVSLRRLKEEKQLKLHYRVQLSSAPLPTSQPQIIQEPKKKKQVDRGIGFSSTWNAIFQSYKLKKKMLLA